MLSSAVVTVVTSIFFKWCLLFWSLSLSSSLSSSWSWSSFFYCKAAIINCHSSVLGVCTFNCDDTTNLCNGHTLSCGGVDTTCVVNCLTSGSCDSSIIVAGATQDNLVVHGWEIDSMVSTRINANNVSYANITCHKNTTCENGQFYFADADNVDIHCLYEDSCKTALISAVTSDKLTLIRHQSKLTAAPGTWSDTASIKVICPSKGLSFTNENKPCQFQCLSGSCSDMLISSRYGFNDVNMECVHENTNSSLCYPNVNMNCSEFSTSCFVGYFPALEKFLCSSDISRCVYESSDDSDNDLLSFDTTSSMAAVSIGIFIVVFSLFSGMVYFKKKGSHISSAIDRWGPVYLFLCLISSFLTLLLSFRNNLMEIPLAAIHSSWFNLIYALLIGSNLCLLITLMPIALYDEYDCTFVGCCASNHARKKQNRSKLRQSSDIFCSTRDGQIFWFGIFSLLLSGAICYAYFVMHIKFALWVFGAVAPFLMAWFYVIFQSRFCLVVVGYLAFVITITLVIGLSDAVSFVVIFWSEIYLILVPMVCLFLLGRKRHLRQMGVTICVVVISVLDLVTDINVIVVWFREKNYWWAIMQLTFNLTAHTLSAIYIRGVKGWKQKSLYDAETGEKERRVVWTQRNGLCHQFLILLGVGRAFYGIKSFKNLDEDHEALDREYYLLKLWEVIYEAYPTFVLQYYVVLRTDQKYGSSIFASLIASFIAVTFSMMKILYSEQMSKEQLRMEQTKHAQTNAAKKKRTLSKETAGATTDTTNGADTPGATETTENNKAPTTPEKELLAATEGGEDNLTVTTRSPYGSISSANSAPTERGRADSLRSEQPQNMVIMVPTTNGQLEMYQVNPITNVQIDTDANGQLTLKPRAASVSSLNDSERDDNEDEDEDEFSIGSNKSGQSVRSNKSAKSTKSNKSTKSTKSTTSNKSNKTNTTSSKQQKKNDSTKKGNGKKTSDKKSTNNGKKKTTDNKKTTRKKGHERRFGVFFGIILYVFMVTDLYIRVTPLLVLVLLYEKKSVEIFVGICACLAVFEFLMLRFVLLKEHVEYKWKESLKYFSIGMISSSYYLLCCIGLKFLPQNISFRPGLATEHVIRLCVAVIAALLGIYEQTNTGWVFNKTTGLLFGMLGINFISFLLMLCRLK